MKIKEGFKLKRVGDVNIIVAVGPAQEGFNSVITLNDTCKFFWEKLSEGYDVEGITDAVVSEFNVSREKAFSDVTKFVEQLKAINIVY